MDWNRIETKWHEMARRLQQGGIARAPAGSNIAQSDPGPDTAPQDRPGIPTGRAPDETAARATG